MAIPDADAVDRFTGEVRSIVGRFPGLDPDAPTAELVEQVGSLPPDVVVRLADALAEPVVRLCGDWPPRDVIEALPRPVRQRFVWFVVGVFAVRRAGLV